MHKMIKKRRPENSDIAGRYPDRIVTAWTALLRERAWRASGHPAG